MVDDNQPAPLVIENAALAGDLTLATLQGRAPDFSALRQDMAARGKAALDVSRLGRLDTVGAAQLLRFLNEVQGLQLHGLSPVHKDLLDRIAALPGEELPVQKRPSAMVETLAQVGRAADKFGETLIILCSFLGQVTVYFSQILIGRRKFRSNSFVRHVREAGLNAVPIVALISFLMSVVLAYQGVAQLETFGAQRFSINLVAISVLREMGGLLAAIMVAGRSGSSFTSEIGVMKIREEVDALEVMGLDAMDVMVLPRVAALVVVLPLLTFIAMLAGMLGGGLVSVASLGIDFETYLTAFANAVNIKSFLVGMIKAPVFALFIAMISCIAGMRVSGSASSVGQQTTSAVVQSIFAVLVIDAIFSIFFSQIGW